MKLRGPTQLANNQPRNQTNESFSPFEIWLKKYNSFLHRFTAHWAFLHSVSTQLTRAMPTQEDQIFLSVHTYGTHCLPRKASSQSWVLQTKLLINTLIWSQQLCHELPKVLGLEFNNLNTHSFSLLQSRFLNNDCICTINDLILFNIMLYWHSGL